MASSIDFIKSFRHGGQARRPQLQHQQQYQQHQSAHINTIPSQSFQEDNQAFSQCHSQVTPGPFSSALDIFRAEQGDDPFGGDAADYGEGSRGEGEMVLDDFDRAVLSGDPIDPQGGNEQRNGPAFNPNNNVVVAAPTGSGKTALLELAICRLISSSDPSQYKIIYQAPTKSLCAERQRDWQAKFGTLNLQCAVLTGDTDQSQLRHVQAASIIITTPEKWDSMTRKWKDHVRLMQLVKLFLIDEVHLLKDTRGATLEAVVSRMKSVGTDVRFLALSATVPNLEDVAIWLGKNATNHHLPACQEKFGEEFRPVRLQKFVYGFKSGGNDFAFDKILESKLPDLISKHSSGKPIMVFCCTRNSALATAKALSNLWATRNPRDRNWSGPKERLNLRDNELRICASSGVAFHHGGLDINDRHAVEKGFLEGQLNVICCTSTLSVGVNLPCHLVIIKNTVSWQDTGLQEYADLEVMQMLGRAGRPQFDDSAVALIMTKSEKVKRYEMMVSGQELLESWFANPMRLISQESANFPANAEIGLGTIDDLDSAKRWLKGTFLYVRLLRNPNHYKLEGCAVGGDIDERLEQICDRDVGLLRDSNLVSFSNRLACTEFGDAMTRYYIKFATMKVILQLEKKAKMSEMLSAIAHADEFRDIRLKAGEKSLFKEINKGGGIKFPIKVDVAVPAHKISLIIQNELGGMEFPASEQFQKHRQQYQHDKGTIFQHIQRLIYCIVDCQLHLKDSTAVRHGLELARSFASKVWDTSPLQMRQIDQIGAVAVRRLMAAGINNIESLEATDSHRIEMIMSRNPPFGHKILDKVKEFPKLKISASIVGKNVRAGESVEVKVKAEISFLNEKLPNFFHKKPVFICFLAELSNGLVLEFRRMPARNLTTGHEVLFTAQLSKAGQYISCYVMCHEIAGTMKSIDVIPEHPQTAFPIPTLTATSNLNKNAASSVKRNSTRDNRPPQQRNNSDDEDFGDEDFDETDFDIAPGVEFTHIDAMDNITSETRKTSRPNQIPRGIGEHDVDNDIVKPSRAEGGKWACNHKCKDKTACRHLCCREGVDHPPRGMKSKIPSEAIRPSKEDINQPRIDQIKTPLSIRSSAISNAKGSDVEVLDMSSSLQPIKGKSTKRSPKEYQALNKLHSTIQKGATLSKIQRKDKDPQSYSGRELPAFSFLDRIQSSPSDLFSPEKNDKDEVGPLPSPTSSVFFRKTGLKNTTRALSMELNSSLEIGQIELEEALTGLDDSFNLMSPRKSPETVAHTGFGSPKGSLEASPKSKAISWSSSPTRIPPSSFLPIENAEESLFMSDRGMSSSPPKRIYSVEPKKRHQGELEGTSRLDLPIPKRLRLQAPAQTPVKEVQNLGGPCPSVEDSRHVDAAPPLPVGWEGIDPALFAEFGDIVELV
ncbi:MAG: hypothetical protein M4579_002776 [Chaenotheca gracillima]|nr:MAG: hypothetical protein M4579_002776 [Chaenotheca gracillima]